MEIGFSSVSVDLVLYDTWSVSMNLGEYQRMGGF